MQFAAFTDRVAEVEAEEADLETVSLVAALLADADEDLAVVTRFLLGRVFPGWDSRTLDVGPALCYEALARAAGPNTTAADVEDRLAEEGEIGAVAAGLDLGGQQGLGAFGSGAGGNGSDEGVAEAGPSVADVDGTLREVAAVEGSGSEDAKLTALFGQFSRVSPEGARYLARLVLGEMRIGVGEGTVRDAVSEAFDVPVEAVAAALQVSNDYGMVAELAHDEGEAGLREVSLEVGRPVKAMLAQAGTVSGALEEWDEVAAEIKFDGARVQLHHHPEGIPPADADREATEADPRARLYSRNMEDVTAALPEVREYVEARLDAPAIVDGEVVAVDDAGDPLPFQEVLRRFRRKHDVDRMREEVELDLHAFDCLLDGRESANDDPGDSGGDAGASDDSSGDLDANGDLNTNDDASDDLNASDDADLLDAPFRDRHDRLARLLPDAASDVLYSDDAKAVETFEVDALAAGHEGVMLKNPESAYTPGNRGKNWLKRKPDVETLDCVVTGAEWGEGRRATFFGTFLLSVRGEETGEYETVGKVATGITDERLAELTDLLEPHVVREEGQTVTLRPEVVFEVGYEEIQRSPTYSAGYALRFPRFVEVREDKDPADADTLQRVERLAEGEEGE